MEVHDIDTDPALLSRYTTRIPVIVGPSGRILAEGIIDARSLKRALVAEARTFEDG